MANPIEIFYSYSHKDEALKQDLINHLSILRRKEVIVNWHDRMIGAGEEWRGQINAHLNSASIILLLISSDFIASDYCVDIEMIRAMERHDAGEARVIPIILRPVDWEDALFSKLQALPAGGKAVTQWSNNDEAFLDIAKGIRAAVTELNLSKNVPSESNLGDLDGDKQYLEQLLRSLPIEEEIIGTESQRVAISLNNIGAVLPALGDLEGSKQHLERALSIYEKKKVYGPKRLYMVTILENLSKVLLALGDLEGSKQHYERALAIKAKQKK